MNKSTEQEANPIVVLIIGLGFLVLCFALLFGMAYGFGPILYILAFLVTFGTLTPGILLIVRSYSSGDHEIKAVTDEIEAMARDASFDISEQIIFWDKIKYTKGVGTQLEGREHEIADIHRRLMNVREEIAAAETPQHYLQAVLAADSILTTTRSML